MKNLKTLLKTDKVPALPRSIQNSIPISRIYRGGIWQVASRFSRSWRFSDINYGDASRDDQMDMFLSYCNVLNSLPNGGITKITVNNRQRNQKEFAQAMLWPDAGDGHDELRHESNDNLLDKAAASNNIVQEKYITIAAPKKNIEDARNFFTRVHNDLVASMGKLQSGCVELDNIDRLRILHDFFRMGEEQYFDFDLLAAMRKGHDFRDYICPNALEFKSDHFIIGKKVGRVLFLKEYASFIKDSIISELADFSRNLMVTVDIIPVPTDEAVKEMNNRVMAVESDINRWQQKQNMQNNFSATIPFDMEQMRKETKEFLDDLTGRDQRMMFGTITLVHIADTMEQLDADTETLLSIGRKHLCQFAPLYVEQEKGLQTVLPYGLHTVENKWRTLTTESAAVFMPFNTQEIMHPGGIYYGVNAVSRNLIMVDRTKLLNGNSFVLGVSGSGKSFAAKQQIISTILSDNLSEVLICDPEREYGPLVRALGGEVCVISATSKNHLNAMALSSDLDSDENPIILKSEFIMSLCEQLLAAGSLGAREKSVIDRCTANVYRRWMADTSQEQPTLKDFHAELLQQPEPQAADLALALELFTTGSLNVFAHQTNVDIQKRLVAFDILELGQLKTVGMLVMLDAIMNRVIENRKKGIRTHVFIDEIWLFFANDHSAAGGNAATSYTSEALSTAFKRFRKYNAQCTGITQNVSDCLQSHTARNMLANSEFLLMLNQAPTDRAELAKLLNISDTQMSYITNAESGRGLLKVGASLVPFINDFPRTTRLYSLMTTRPGEGEFAEV